MRLTLTLISLLTVIASTAQIKPGIKLGMNISTFQLDRKVDPMPSRIGVNAGLVAQVPIYKKFFVQPELLYTQKGHRYPPDVAYHDGQETFTYAALAAIAGYRIIPQLHAGIGPEVGYLLKQKIKLDNGHEFGDDPNFEDWDVSLNFHLAFYPVRNLAIEGRYQRGLKNIYNVELTDPIGYPTGETLRLGKNHTFQVNVVYFYARGKK